MPAAFELESNEFVISRYSRAHPDFVLQARARNRDGVLRFALRAPGHDDALQDLRRALEAKYDGVEADVHEASDGPILEYTLPVQALQGILGPVLSLLAERSETVYFRLQAGTFTFWFPDLAAGETQRTLGGRLGLETAPEVKDRKPDGVMDWS